MEETMLPKASLSNDFYAIPIKEFFKLAISVDCVIFGHEGRELKVLLIQRGAEPYLNYWALPGDLVYPNEDVDSAAQRIVHDLTSIDKMFFEQVAVFGEPNRHPLGRVITTGYVAFVELNDYRPVAATWAKQAVWHNVHNIPELAFDHAKIFQTALTKLQDSVRHKPVGSGILKPKFTITELQELYEAIYSCTYDKGNFRKKLAEWNYLVDHKEYQKNVPHRPAKMFSFDKKRYEELEKRGFSFDL